MYAIRISPKGEKPQIIRLNTQDEARKWVESCLADGTPAKYIGKVKVNLNKSKVTNADPKRR